mmetsp:Transcript_2307/g.4252  ORF Transcript_2307/g.4252 Transcript_2307/m.4252 type:complete len:345 (+) Transcript_2307:137-1171(+)
MILPICLFALASARPVMLRMKEAAGGHAIGSSTLIPERWMSGRNCPRWRRTTRRMAESEGAEPEPDHDREAGGDKAEKERKQMYFVTLGVPSYVGYDKDIHENPQVRLEQKNYVRAKMKDGTLQAYGPLRGLIFPPTTPQDVALWVIRAKSVEEAKSIVEVSPYCKSKITSGCRIIPVSTEITGSRETEQQDYLEDLTEAIAQARVDVEASKKVHQLLQRELETAHDHLKKARTKYDAYSREVNLMRFDWMSSGSYDTLERLKPVYEGLEKLAYDSKAKTQNEIAIESAFQNIARDFINVYEQEIDGTGSAPSQIDTSPIAQWVTKVYGQDSKTSEEGGGESGN